MSSVLEDLGGIKEDVWRIWTRAAEDGAQSPGALATLATTRLGGGSSARMIVLRAADQEASTLVFWTNRTSQKVVELAQTPSAALVFWLPDDQLQIRADAIIRTSQGKRETWDSLGENARRNYLAYAKPDGELSTPEDNSARPDFQNFMVLTAKVDRIDVLSLAHNPHRRAVCDNEGVRWVAP